MVERQAPLLRVWPRNLLTVVFPIESEPCGAGMDSLNRGEGGLPHKFWDGGEVDEKGNGAHDSPEWD